jgi:hypothetical protein
MCLVPDNASMPNLIKECIHVDRHYGVVGLKEPAQYKVILTKVKRGEVA